MSAIDVKRQVRSIAARYGPWAARQWIVESVHDSDLRAVAFAALFSMVA